MSAQHRRAQASAKRSRHGIAALVALACLSFAFVVGSLLLQAGMAEQRYANHLVLRRQADWLAEAGIGKAAAQLARSPEYTGESWPLAPSSLGGAQGAIVHIEVAKAPEDPKIRTVRVVADFNPGDPLAIRATKEIRLHVDKR